MALVGLVSRMPTWKGRYLRATTTQSRWRGSLAPSVQGPAVSKVPMVGVGTCSKFFASRRSTIYNARCRYSISRTAGLIVKEKEFGSLEFLQICQSRWVVRCRPPALPRCGRPTAADHPIKIDVSKSTEVEHWLCTYPPTVSKYGTDDKGPVCWPGLGPSAGSMGTC